MNDVVERMAKAHFEERGFALPTDATWEQIGAIRQVTLIAKMRAAIEAMREPTEAMLEAVKPWPDHWPKEGPEYPARHAAYLIDQATARSDWQAMLSAALADASPDIGKEGIGNDVR